MSTAEDTGKESDVVWGQQLAHILQELRNRDTEQ